MQSGSYFPSAEPGLTALLDAFLSELAEDLEAQTFRGDVAALLLAGGYGRGEGGIFRDSNDGPPKLYNDLEFYLILRTSATVQAAEAWCASWAHAGDERLGIEVEFKVLGETAFQAGEPSMFFYDLLAACRVVFGPADFTEKQPASLRDPARIPAHEATRLMFNRGTGLFYSHVALKLGDERVTSGFIERNHAKVRMALADAVLAINGRYHFSCRHRHERLAEPLSLTPPDWETLRAWHAAGVEFKLHPRHTTPELKILKATQAEIVHVWMRTFLWLESLRLGATFSTPEAYATYRGRLFPKTGRARNVALHLRDKLKRGAALPAWSDYPRAPLQRALCLLLSPQPDYDRAARHLGLAPGANLTALHDTYERWWKCYN